MSEPTVVFEPVLGRWRVEYRNHPTCEWQTEVYASTLEEACEVAQEMTNHDLDGVYRVVDTWTEKVQPDAVRVGDEMPLTLDQYQEQAKATAVYPNHCCRERNPLMTTIDHQQAAVRAGAEASNERT